MARIKIDLPPVFSFSTTIPIRITDINYGGHVGNDTVLSLLHEARMQFLKSFEYHELDIGGIGLIMSDVVITFNKELFYGDSIRVSVSAGEFRRASFALFYKIEAGQGKDSLLIATAKTGMVCYDYNAKKVAMLPAGVQSRLMMEDKAD